MTSTELQQVPSTARAKTSKPRLETLVRILKYAGVRLLGSFFAIVVGVYLTVLIANMGGYVDEIKKGQIYEQVVTAAMGNPELTRNLDPASYQAYLTAQVEVEMKRLGLDVPFPIRSVKYLWNALTLNLGHAEELFSDSGSSLVRQIILERLPATLVLFATADIILFVAAVFTALYLSRRYGSWLDRTVVALTPTSAAPAWFYGMFLIMIFAGALKVLPFGGMVDAPPPASSLGYALSVAVHLILPVAAIFIGSIFLTTYSWRTFFLIYSSEDYVDMAKAKGLSSGAIERRYVLRPTLPTIITSFALMLIGLWTGAIVLETVFNWPGLGRLLYQAIGQHDTPVIVGSTVIYAYLLGITVFILDIVYALVDPRVKVGAGGTRS
jgi:peptide/nickel transport system permease protein